MRKLSNIQREIKKDSTKLKKTAKDFGLTKTKENPEKQEYKGRKGESKFVTSVLSRIGSGDELYDYYAYIELDDFACWVVATALNDERASKIVTDEILQTFIKKPGLSKKLINKMISTAEEKIFSLQSKKKQNIGLGCTIGILVTDYRSIMIANVGDVRVGLLRDEMLYHISGDDTIAHLIYEADELSYEEIRFHPRRSELTQYIGDYRRVRPHITGKIDLEEGDKAIFLTKGAWEKLDSSDLEVELSKSSGVGKWIGLLEKRILEDQSTYMNNYTLLGIYFDDLAPGKSKGKFKLNKWFIIIPIIIILIILIYLGTTIRRDITKEHQEIEVLEVEAEEKIKEKKYNSAIDNLSEIETLYGVLQGKIKDTNWYEKIILTPEILNDGYEKQVKQIQKKISTLETVNEIEDSIEETTTIFEDNDFVKAHEGYKGAQLKLNALKSEEWLDVTELEKEVKNYVTRSEILTSGTKLMEKADELVEENMIPEAIDNYLEAKLVFLKYEELELITEINTKVEYLTAQRKEKLLEAENYEKTAIKTESRDIDEAIINYRLARNLYRDLGENALSDEMGIKIVELNELKEVLKVKNNQMLNNAKLYAENREYDSAVQSLEEAKSIAKKLKDGQILANTAEEEGDYFFKLKKYPESSKKYADSLEDNTNIGNEYKKLILKEKIELVATLEFVSMFEAAGDKEHKAKNYKIARANYQNALDEIKFLEGNKYYLKEDLEKDINRLEEKEKKAWKESNWIPFF